MIIRVPEKSIGIDLSEHSKPWSGTESQQSSAIQKYLRHLFAIGQNVVSKHPANITISFNMIQYNLALKWVVR